MSKEIRQNVLLALFGKNPAPETLDDSMIAAAIAEGGLKMVGLRALRKAGHTEVVSALGAYKEALDRGEVGQWLLSLDPSVRPWVEKLVPPEALAARPAPSPAASPGPSASPAVEFVLTPAPRATPTATTPPVTRAAPTATSDSTWLPPADPPEPPTSSSASDAASSAATSSAPAATPTPEPADPAEAVTDPDLDDAHSRRTEPGWAARSEPGEPATQEREPRRRPRMWALWAVGIVAIVVLSMVVINRIFFTEDEPDPEIAALQAQVKALEAVVEAGGSSATAPYEEESKAKIEPPQVTLSTGAICSLSNPSDAGANDRCNTMSQRERPGMAYPTLCGEWDGKTCKPFAE